MRKFAIISHALSILPAVPASVDSSKNPTFVTYCAVTGGWLRPRLLQASCRLTHIWCTLRDS